MEKKLKFSDNPNFAKTVYGVIIVALCITAIVIGIVAANNRSENVLQNDPPVTNLPDTDVEESDNKAPVENEKPDEEKSEPLPQKKPGKKTFLSPVSGNVSKGHSLSVPVFSATLEEWRVHSGIDIECEEGASVFAAFDGTVSKVYSDPLLGCTVVIDHGENVSSIYSNLENDDSLVAVGRKVQAGEAIGTVGDSSLSELAEEPHLHFEVSVDGVKANPLDYISDEAKLASLGIPS